MITHVLEGLAVALVACLALLAVALVWLRPRDMPMKETARLVPDSVRLVRSLARDPTVPRSVRWRLLIAVAYNAQPINLIPDFVPVIGFADNIVVVAWALRGTVRKTGPETIARHWHGSEETLALLYRLVRVRPPDGQPTDAS